MSQTLPTREGEVHVGQPANTMRAQEGPAARRTRLRAPWRPHTQCWVLCSVSGKTLWSQPSRFGGNVSVLSPLLRVPDLDADGAPDLLVLIQEENQVPPHPSCAASPPGPCPGP